MLPTVVCDDKVKYFIDNYGEEVMNAAPDHVFGCDHISVLGIKTKHISQCGKTWLPFMAPYLCKSGVSDTS